MWTQSVSADTARLQIALDSTLFALPQGASYTARSGRASVKASVKQSADGTSATIIIESSCDSLARLCSYYERQNEWLSVANTQLSNTVETVTEERKNTIGRYILMAIAGIMAGIVITLITRRIWQRQY